MHWRKATERGGWPSEGRTRGRAEATAAVLAAGDATERALELAQSHHELRLELAQVLAVELHSVGPFFQAHAAPTPGAGLFVAQQFHTGPVQGVASADPVYQRGPSRCWAGTGVMYSPARPESRQFCEMCRSSECDLYWVRTQIRR